MNRQFERAARARRRKAAIITAVFTTGFFYLLTIGGSADLRDYLPEFIEQYLPATETPATAAEEPVATPDTVRP